MKHICTRLFRIVRTHVSRNPVEAWFRGIMDECKENRFLSTVHTCMHWSTRWYVHTTMYYAGIYTYICTHTGVHNIV